MDRQKRLLLKGEVISLYKPQKVINYHFFYDSYWIKLGTSTIADSFGKVVGMGAINSSGSFWTIQQPDMFEDTKVYRIRFKVRSTGAAVAFQLGAEYNFLVNEVIVGTDWWIKEIEYTGSLGRDSIVMGGPVGGTWDMDYITIEEKK